MKRDFTAKASAALVPDLMAGEQIEQSVVGEPEGSLLASMSAGKRLGLAAWDAKKIRDSRDPDTMAAAVGRKRHLLTRTNQRLLFHEVSITVKPTKLALALPLDDQLEVASLKVKRKQYVLVRFPDDSAQAFLCHHNQPIDRIGPLVEMD